MNGIETDRLLRLVAKGDNDAFEQLYLKTKRGVYAFLYSYFKNQHDTEDAMQTVYLKIKTHVSSYKVGTNGRAWIFQIAKNHALTELKKNSRKEEYEDKSSVGFTQGEVFDAMQRALSEEEQRIVILHVLWGYKHREISKLIESPIGTVVSKYKRAIDKLKKALKEDNL
ncbi:MAG: RNA polymerase sigma factor [Clostridiales bacterium]|nr:RNA polymerase sigma factor [Clostridiales bacterium]